MTFFFLNIIQWCIFNIWYFLEKYPTSFFFVVSVTLLVVGLLPITYWLSNTFFFPKLKDFLFPVFSEFYCNLKVANIYFNNLAQIRSWIKQNIVTLSFKIQIALSNVIRIYSYCLKLIAHYLVASRFWWDDCLHLE